MSRHRLDKYKMAVMGDDGTYEGGWTREKGIQRAQEWNASLDEQVAEEDRRYAMVMERLRAAGVEIEWRNYSHAPSMIVTIDGEELPEVAIEALA